MSHECFEALPVGISLDLDVVLDTVRHRWRAGELAPDDDVDPPQADAIGACFSEEVVRDASCNGEVK